MCRDICNCSVLRCNRASRGLMVTNQLVHEAANYGYQSVSLNYMFIFYWCVGVGPPWWGLPLSLPCRLIVVSYGCQSVSHSYILLERAERPNATQ